MTHIHVERKNWEHTYAVLLYEMSFVLLDCESTIGVESQHSGYMTNLRMDVLHNLSDQFHLYVGLLVRTCSSTSHIFTIMQKGFLLSDAEQRQLRSDRDRKHELRVEISTLKKRVVELMTAGKKTEAQELIDNDITPKADKTNK